MLLAVMNQIQGIYHFKSLGRKIDFTIVHLELMKGAAFPEHGGEREQLLTEFCKYQVNTKCTFYSPSHVISSNKKDKKQSQFLMKAIYFYNSSQQDPFPSCFFLWVTFIATIKRTEIFTCSYELNIASMNFHFLFR